MKSNSKAASAGPAARRARREFSTEFKAEAVRLVTERRGAGETLAQIGRDLDVRPDQLRAWVQQQRREGRGGGALPAETMEQENRRLRRENAVLRQEQAFAKKVAADSTDRCNTLGKYSGRRAKAEGFSGTGVELECDAIEVALTVHG